MRGKRQTCLGTQTKHPFQPLRAQYTVSLLHTSFRFHCLSISFFIHTHNKTCTVSQSVLLTKPSLVAIIIRPRVTVRGRNTRWKLRSGRWYVGTRRATSPVENVGTNSGCAPSSTFECNGLREPGGSGEREESREKWTGTRKDAGTMDRPK